MAGSTLAVEHLFSLQATTQQVAVIQGAPHGSRVVVNITGGSFKGPKLSGTVEASGGDWVTMRPDGSARLDVRITLKTDDGAHILMTYTGVGVQKDGGMALRSAPLFETGDSRYAWLNSVQAIGKGTPGPGTVEYEVYAVL